MNHGFTVYCANTRPSAAGQFFGGAYFRLRIFRAPLLRVHSIYIHVYELVYHARRREMIIIIFIINFNICNICTARRFMKINEVQISSRAFCVCVNLVRPRTHEYIQQRESRICIIITLLQIREEDMQDIIETHSKNQEDCTKLSSDDLQTLSGNNWLNDKVNNNPLTL